MAIEPIGEPFSGSLRRALGCCEGHRATGEFTVLGYDMKMTRVCREHLAPAVREIGVRTGMGVMVTDAVLKGDCVYVA